MSDSKEFSFGDNSVAEGYDSALVPVLFTPWAKKLVDENGPWQGRRVLDLATGTGIVAQHLSEKVGPDGKVFGADINAEMLTVAKKRCAGLTPEVTFVETPAHPLEFDSNSVDFVLCQQGFQFFPEKTAAAKEIYRVLSDGGQSVVTTWCPLDDCQFFGTMRDALNAVGEIETAEMISVPFDMMPGDELVSHFNSAGFQNVKLERQEKDLILEGGIEQAIKVPYSSPVGQMLKELPEDRQEIFNSKFAELLNELSDDGFNMGRMVSHVLSATKPNGSA